MVHREQQDDRADDRHQETRRVEFLTGLG